jgi:hypothetical protein
VASETSNPTKKIWGLVFKSTNNLKLVCFKLIIYTQILNMEFLDSLSTFLVAINFKLIFQLTCLALVVISGPVVIFLLAARGGDL